jgi:hypothetical protein
LRGRGVLTRCASTLPCAHATSCPALRRPSPVLGLARNSIDQATYAGTDT